MFRRLRRSTKQSQTSKCEAPNLTGRRRTSFFDLPAELRNHIYALAVQHIQQLRIVPRTSPIHVPIKRKDNRQNDRIPALFVTSRQCRAEYLPILLATAPIEIRILDFDFRSLGRIIGSLYSSELKALRSNSRLTLRLYFSNRASSSFSSSSSPSCSSSSSIPNTFLGFGLYTWIKSRAAGMDRIPWRYALPVTMTRNVQQQRKDVRARSSSNSISSSTCSSSNSNSRSEVVNYDLCMSTLVKLHQKVFESFQWEIMMIMRQLESQYEEEEIVVVEEELRGGAG
ncbi:hypothetical protein SMMN14_04293 [Sphaerulina musiva]